MTSNPAALLKTDSISTLQALGLAAPIYGNIFVQSVGGTYIWNAASTATPDGVTIVQAAGVATGRYLLEVGRFLQATITATGQQTDALTFDGTITGTDLFIRSSSSHPTVNITQMSGLGGAFTNYDGSALITGGPNYNHSFLDEWRNIIDVGTNVNFFAGRFSQPTVNGTADALYHAVFNDALGTGKISDNFAVVVSNLIRGANNRALDLRVVAASPIASSTLVWSGGNVTLTSSIPHGFRIGATLDIGVAGVTPPVVDGTYTAAVTGASTLLFPLVSDPGAISVPGTWTQLRYNLYEPDTATGLHRFVGPITSNGPLTVNNNVAVTGTATIKGVATVNTLLISGGVAVQQTVQNSFLYIGGGTTPNVDASTATTGSTFPSTPNYHFVSADTTVFRSANTATLYGGFSISGLGVGTQTFGTSAVNVIAILNGTAPASSPANTGQIYVEGGALKYRGAGGTVTTVAAS